MLPVNIMNLPFSFWVYVRSHNLGIERDENKKERHNYSASVYGLYLHVKTLFSLHLSLIHLIVYNTLFIEKQSDRVLQVFSTSILTIINLVYHLITLVS
jgi:hypothetical protein